MRPFSTDLLVILTVLSRGKRGTNETDKYEIVKLKTASLNPGTSSYTAAVELRLLPLLVFTMYTVVYIEYSTRLYKYSIIDKYSTEYPVKGMSHQEGALTFRRNRLM